MKPIWKHLPVHMWFDVFDKLPYNDLQQVRLVCRDWKDVADSPALSRRSKFKIMDNNVEAIAHYMMKKSKYPQLFPCARHVHISIYMMPRNRAWLEFVLSTIGPKVESLIIAQQYILKFLPAEGLPNLKELTVCHDLGYMPVNRELKFDYQKYLKLQSLELNNLGTEEQSSILNKLLKSGNLLNIRKLRLQYTDKLLEDVILKVLNVFSKNLTMVHVTFNSKPNPSIDCDAWGKAFSVMSKLENIGVFGHCTSHFLQVVLNSIPEKAPMNKIDMSGTFALLDQHVKYMLSKWSKSLKYLKFGSCPEISYLGLQHLTCVKDNLQSLNLSHCQYVKRNELLDGLCALNNNTLRQLYLNNMQGLDEELLCCLARRYNKLKVLTLNNSNKAVTNYAISYVFQHLLHLQRLELNDCYSDVGLLGTRERPYSIARLRWLQALSIENTGLITNASFRIFNFPYLREFHFGYSQDITAKTIKRFTKNCSSLEILSMTCCYYLDDKVVKHIYKNLKRLIILNIKNCPKITPRSIEYLKRCRLLRELSISGQNQIHVTLMKTSWTSAIGDRKKIHCRVL